MFDRTISIVAKAVLILIWSTVLVLVSFGYHRYKQYDLKPHELLTPVILPMVGHVASDEIKTTFKAINPFGFIIARNNVKSESQAKELISELKSLFPNRKVYVFVDQEGGNVDFLRNIVTKQEKKKFLKKASYYSDIAAKNISKAKETIYRDSKNTAIKLKEIGVDATLAPMIDIIHDDKKEEATIKNSWAKRHNRSYGKDPETVTILAREFIRGMHDGGILVTVKHMPGLGQSYSDSHDGEVTIDATLESLKKTDFIPFKELKEVSDFAMVGHAIYSKIDDKPASLSKKVIDVIRNEIEFDGLIISDALNMESLEKFSLEERVKQSFASGVDIIVPHYTHKDMQTVITNSIDEKHTERFNEKIRNYTLVPNSKN